MNCEIPPSIKEFFTLLCMKLGTTERETYQDVDYYTVAVTLNFGKTFVVVLCSDPGTAIIGFREYPGKVSKQWFNLAGATPEYIDTIADMLLSAQL